MPVGDRPPLAPKVRVLVVDDEASMRELLRRLLVLEFDVDVIQADDGLSALDQILTGTVDVVLLDLSMRVMQGLETLAAVRRSRSFADLPVVVITGLPDEDRMRQAIELGISGTIAKPFTVAGLRERLAPVIATRHASGEPQVERCVFDVEPTHRVIVADVDPVFRRVAARLWSLICVTEEAENEVAALTRCLAHPPDVLVVGATSEFSTLDLFARRVRGLRQLRQVRIIAAVPHAELGSAATSGLYDAVLERRVDQARFDASLQRVLSEETLSRVTLHPASASVADLVGGFQAALGQILGAHLTVHEAPPRPLSEPVWVVAEVIVSCGRLPWHVRLRVTLALGFALASGRLQVEPERLSQAVMTAAVGEILVPRIVALRSDLLERGLASQSTEPQVTVLGEAGGHPSADEVLGARRWLLTPTGGLAVVEVAPRMTRC